MHQAWQRCEAVLLHHRRLDGAVSIGVTSLHASPPLPLPISLSESLASRGGVLIVNTCRILSNLSLRLNNRRSGPNCLIVPRPRM